MKTKSTLLVSTLFLGTLAAGACSDEGTSTSCEPMPLEETAVAENEQHSAQVQRWWDEAVDEGCATAKEVPVFGAAGAKN